VGVADHALNMPTPRETLARCSVRAEFREDPMLGTAFPASQLLLIEQPGPWGRGGLANSHCDPHVAAQVLNRFDRAGVRVLTIRRPGRTPELSARRWARVDCRPGGEAMVWGSFHTDVELLDLPLEPPMMPVSHDPAGSVFLVCTHGSHDACCALRGRPVAAALHELRPERVWECSHVGGDRFAANVLVLPTGMLYGSVHTREATELVAAAERGLVLPGPLRGKVGLAPEAQAALAFAQRQTGAETAEFRIAAVQRNGSAVATVTVHRLDGPSPRSAVVEVRIGRSPVHRLTCQMASPATVLTYQPKSLVWL
jgi:hypothetical protein